MIGPKAGEPHSGTFLPIANDKENQFCNRVLGGRQTTNAPERCSEKSCAAAVLGLLPRPVDRPGKR